MWLTVQPSFSQHFVFEVRAMAEQKLSSSKYLGDDYHKEAEREIAREGFRESAESIVIWGLCAVLITAIVVVIQSQ